MVIIAELTHHSAGGGISPALFEILFRLKVDEVYRSMRERMERLLEDRHMV